MSNTDDSAVLADISSWIKYTCLEVSYAEEAHHDALNATDDASCLSGLGAVVAKQNQLWTNGQVRLFPFPFLETACS